MKVLIVVNAYIKNASQLSQAERIAGELSALGAAVEVKRNFNLAEISGNRVSAEKYGFCVYLDKDRVAARLLEKSGLRLFNTAEGKDYLLNTLKLDPELVERLSWLGISGIANVLCCIKMAKYYEFTEKDVLVTVLTDSAAMYQSRIDELSALHGPYDLREAALDHHLHMLGLKTDSMLELSYTDRKRIHNLKYYTWVEQQARDVADLNALWYDPENTWDAVHAQAAELDALIEAFNVEAGVLRTM